jgi:hypothetical protein
LAPPDLALVAHGVYSAELYDVMSHAAYFLSFDTPEQATRWCELLHRLPRWTRRGDDAVDDLKPMTVPVVAQGVDTATTSASATPTTAGTATATGAAVEEEEEVKHDTAPKVPSLRKPRFGKRLTVVDALVCVLHPSSSFYIIWYVSCDVM